MLELIYELERELRYYNLILEVGIFIAFGFGFLALFIGVIINLRNKENY